MEYLDAFVADAGPFSLSTLLNSRITAINSHNKTKLATNAVNQFRRMTAPFNPLEAVDEMLARKRKFFVLNLSLMNPIAHFLTTGQKKKTQVERCRWFFLRIENNAVQV